MCNQEQAECDRRGPGPGGPGTFRNLDPFGGSRIDRECLSGKPSKADSGAETEAHWR